MEVLQSVVEHLPDLFHSMFFVFSKISRPFSSACSAMTFIFMESCIFFIKKVTIETVCFSSINCAYTYASESINFWSNSFKMIWIYAKSISAQMIYLQSFGNRAFKKLITISMSFYSYGKNLVFCFYNKTSIRLWLCIPNSSSPIPAGFSFFNSFKKSYFWINCLIPHKHELLQMGVVV